MFGSGGVRRANGDIRRRRLQLKAWSFHCKLVCSWPTLVQFGAGRRQHSERYLKKTPPHFIGKEVGWLGAKKKTVWLLGETHLEFAS